MITHAKNTMTGEVKDFPNSCLPSGWVVADSNIVLVSTQPKITSFQIEGGPLAVEGDLLTAKWTSENATRCVPSGDWSGTKASSGTEYLHPSKIGYANYGLICYDASGQASTPITSTPFIASSTTMTKTGTLSVLSAEPLSVAPNNTAIQAILNQPAGMAGLTLIEQTSGPEVTPQTARVFLSQSEVAESTIVFRLGQATPLKAGTPYHYMITAQSGNTTSVVTHQGSFTTAAATAPVGKTGAITMNLEISKSLIQKGESPTLTWSVTNADTCTASGGWSGAKNPVGGSEAVTPKDMLTLYSLDCRNSTSQQGMMVDVTVATDAVAPTVTFSADTYSVKKGDAVTLSWNTNASSCQSFADELKSDGEFTWTQDDEWAASSGQRNTTGSQILHPDITAKYTLNCFNNEKQTIRAVVITVDGKKPAAGGPAISLSKVKVYSQGDETVKYFSYEYGNTPADGSLQQTLIVTKKSTGAVVVVKNVVADVNKGPSGFTSIGGFEYATAYHYLLDLLDPSDGRVAHEEGDFQTGSAPQQKKEEKKDIQVCAQVLTSARNKTSGEVKTFPNSCIPDGWEHVFGDMMQKKAEEKKATSVDKIAAIQQTAGLLGNNKIDELLSQINELRNQVKEQQTEITVLKKVSTELKGLTEKNQQAINAFVTYGVDDNSKNLGQGERAAVVYSYKAAYNKMPQTDQELSDMIKIVNGRFPSERNKEAEKKAQTEFKRIYKRVANIQNANDMAAIIIMSYGLRQAAENRNLSSEQQGVQTFKVIYGAVPKTTEEWNVMQAITYSGASRKADTDRDLLSDEDEKSLGTDLNNPDTDGDGYADGLEVENGYSPLEKVT